jgi:propanol-preferring alcohol dehydrogenase
MRAWEVDEPGPLDSRPLRMVERPTPVPRAGEVRVRVSACGVCRTDLHIVVGDLSAHRRHVVPGHEVVGYVDARGPGAERFELGDRVGVAWLRATCGRCRFCRRGAENLCPDARFTGWDEDGGYAEHAVAPEAFAYPIPESFTDIEAAPLLCAGIIGYRALRRCELPRGGRLGVYGFGASAHITAQLAIADGATVHVMTRSPDAQRLAFELGAASAQGTDAPPPEPLDSAILFAPVGQLVPTALAALDRGGTLAIAGIYLSDIPVLRYADHLFQERTVRSVTANTRDDGVRMLSAAAAAGVRLATVPYPLSEADRALADLAEDRFAGAAVLLSDAAPAASR